VITKSSEPPEMKEFTRYFFAISVAAGRRAHHVSMTPIWPLLIHRLMGGHLQADVLYICAPGRLLASG
jgi:hypothetical protein